MARTHGAAERRHEPRKKTNDNKKYIIYLYIGTCIICILDTRVPNMFVCMYNTNRENELAEELA